MRSFIARLVAIAFLVTSMTGCYMGHSRGAKTAAYAIDGTLVVVGITGIASSSGQHDDAQIGEMLAAVPLIVGLVGIAINLATATDPPSDPPATTTKLRGRDFGSASR